VAFRPCMTPADARGPELARQEPRPRPRWPRPPIAVGGPELSAKRRVQDQVAPTKRPPGRPGEEPVRRPRRAPAPLPAAVGASPSRAAWSHRRPADADDGGVGEEGSAGRERRRAEQRPAPGQEVARPAESGGVMRRGWAGVSAAAPATQPAAAPTRGGPGGALRAVGPPDRGRAGPGAPPRRPGRGPCAGRRERPLAAGASARRARSTLLGASACARRFAPRGDRGMSYRRRPRRPHRELIEGLGQIGRWVTERAGLRSVRVEVAHRRATGAGAPRPAAPGARGASRSRPRAARSKGPEGDSPTGISASSSSSAAPRWLRAGRLPPPRSRSRESQRT
jgi:hypothetical protein